MTDAGRSALKGAGFALLAFGIFATHDVFIKLLGQRYSPVQIIFFSVLFSFPLATIMLLRDSTKRDLRPVHPRWMMLRTFAGVITAFAAFYAFSVLPLAQTYAILFSTPLLITVLSIPVLGERVGLHRWGAVICGLIGVLVVLRPGSEAMGLGHLAAMTAAIGSATASVTTRRIGKDERSAVLMLYPMVASFTVMLCLQPLVYKPMPLNDLGMAGIIAALGFGAALCMISAYRTADAAIVAPMQYSQMLWAALFGALVFGEHVDLMTWIGAVIIISSGLYIVVRESVGGRSEHTPVLRTKSRHETGSGMRVSAMDRAIRSGSEDTR